MSESLKCSLAENQVNLMSARHSNMSELVLGNKQGRSHWKCYKCLKLCGRLGGGRKTQAQFMLGYHCGNKSASFWKCLECGKIKRTDTFNDHRCVRQGRSAKVDSHKKMQCPLCDKTCTFKRINNHMRVAHQ